MVMTEEHVYLPVKITERKYAEQMISEGRILMRPFADFEEYDEDSPYTGENDFGVHLLCMYRLVLELPEKKYGKMDARMRRFGDTAVIITNPGGARLSVLQRGKGAISKFKAELLQDIRRIQTDYF